MTAMPRSYEGDKDFMKIRDFLIETFTLYQGPFNWTIDLWNFVRYFGIPYHNYYNTSYLGVPAYPRRSHRDELPIWEGSIGIWEDESGDVVAAALTQNEEPGEAYLQVHPDHTDLYEEMVGYAEDHLADTNGQVSYVKLIVNDGSDLEPIAREHGYRKLDDTKTHREFTVKEACEPELPSGFRLISVADEDDPEKRRLVRAFSFGPYYSPSEWPPASIFVEMQRAPDYRKDLDLLVVAPNGDYVGFCTVWLDTANGYGMFEPVGVHTDYQRLGLGRALLMEGLRRMGAHGVDRSYMESENEFYRKVGFIKETPFSYTSWIKYTGNVPFDWSGKENLDRLRL